MAAVIPTSPTWLVEVGDWRRAERRGQAGGMGGGRADVGGFWITVCVENGMKILQR